MHFTTTLVGLASLGLNIFPVQSAAVPAVDLSRRADEPIANVYRSDAAEKRHFYRLDQDEATVENRHFYRLDQDEATVENRHFYRPDQDEATVEKRDLSGQDLNAAAVENRHFYRLDRDEA